MKYLSSLVTQGTGVMGNLVLERNGVIRTRNHPANPSTTLQQAVRANLSTSASSWSSALNDAQRLAWNEYAATLSRKNKLGQAKNTSGIDAYVGANAALAHVGNVGVIDPPNSSGDYSLPAVVSVVADDSANTVVVTFAAPIPGTLSLALGLSPGAVSQGRTTYSGPFRKAAIVGGADATAVTFTGITAPATGEKWGYQISGVTDDGQVTQKITGLAVIVA